MRADGKVKHLPDWMMQIFFGLDVALFTGLSFAVLDMNGRRRRAQLAVEAEQREQATLARQLLESRLAAMQAQVEPQFLFDSLVDIEALYRRDAAVGAAVLDRLITYLRAALPGLREAGSTVQAEADLVAAYLSVVAARHGGLPQTEVTVAPDCSAARFHPMLLLPLVQRAVHGNDGTKPRRVELAVRREGDVLIAEVRLAATGLCGDTSDLARVRERIAGLYGGRARLDCVEDASGITTFTLHIPYELADRTRR
jgi:LytS/YehU family sensor histidine kinase